MPGASLAIANAALVFLGEEPLVSDTDDVPAAEVIASQWASLRRSELSTHPWIFAAHRVELGADETAPLFGWSFAYTLPADNLRVLEAPQLGYAWTGRTAAGEPWASDCAPAFELEGAKLLCNQAAPLQLRYIRDTADYQLWPDAFGQVMTYRLAVILAELVTQSSGRRADAAAEYARLVAVAKRNNAIQKPAKFVRAVSPWNAARGGRSW